MNDALLSLLEGPVRRRKLAVLTGAGCSTESGIPDYRGPGTARRARKPVQYRQFVDDAAWRQRYWARAAVGWERIARARPNPAHEALAAWSESLTSLITQNVDGLHQAAGSAGVIELHGSLHRVVCMSCGKREARDQLQERLSLLNPGWERHRGVEAAPDGDAELDSVSGFRVAACLTCGGPLKPDVVFFGESVPRPRVHRALAAVDDAEALLVVGSSLTVYSGYRFVRRAHQRQIPVAILSLGPTRGDPLATVKVEARAGDLLPRLAGLIRPPPIGSGPPGPPARDERDR